LCLARRDGYAVRAFTVEIHDVSESEMKAARKLGERVGVLEHRIVRLPDVREAGDIKESKQLRDVPPTYIPMKNAIYYSLAAAFAEERGSHLLIGGHNGEDRNLFADTSEEFFASLQKALLAGSPRLKSHGLEILRPLRDMGKAEVITLAKEIGVPLELTWSCYKAGSSHCWRCDGCRKREAAFRAAGVPDPLAPARP